MDVFFLLYKLLYIPSSCDVVSVALCGWKLVPIHQGKCSRSNEEPIYTNWLIDQVVSAWCFIILRLVAFGRKMVISLVNANFAFQITANSWLQI